jgi:hypothetical protein
MAPRHTTASGTLLATLLAGAAAPGCSAPAPSRDTQKADPQKGSSMDDLLQSLDHHADVAVTVRQGTEHFDDGQITLVVRGDGKVTVDQLAAGATQHYALKLDAARVAQLGNLLAAHRFTAARTTTLPRQPGDTQLALRVERGGSQAFQAELWDADRYKDADLDAILHAADALIHEASGGKLGQPAP